MNRPTTTPPDAVILTQISDPLRCDRELGRRREARVRVCMPARVFLLREGRLERILRATTRDISVTSMSVELPVALVAGQHVEIELPTGHHHLSGSRMRVVHCYRTLHGYRVGLEREAGGPVVTPLVSSETEGAVEETQTLGLYREEIRRAIQEHQRSRRWLGLKGRSLRKRLLASMPSLAAADADVVELHRRCHPRLSGQGEVSAVFPSSYGWKLLPGQLIDVGCGGAGVRLEIQAPEDWIEYEMIGGFVPYTGLMLALALGTEMGRLWLPGRIAHCGGLLHRPGELGVEFVFDVRPEIFGVASSRE